jgi:hypothetical protein
MSHYIIVKDFQWINPRERERERERERKTERERERERFLRFLAEDSGHIRCEALRKESGHWVWAHTS